MRYIDAPGVGRIGVACLVACWRGDAAPWRHGLFIWRPPVIARPVARLVACWRGGAAHTHQLKEAPCVYDVVTRPISCDDGRGGG